MPRMAESDRTATLAARVHDQRAALVDELHARPFPVITRPTAVVHVAVLAASWSAEDQDAHLGELYRAFGQQPASGPDQGKGPHRLAAFGELEARIERHQEFVSYTLFAPATGPRFAGGVLARLPPGWIERIRGEIVVLLRLRVESGGADDPGSLTSLLGGTPVGGQAVDGTASVWTSFRLDEAGFDRVLVRNHALTPERCGRLVQRLIEIETYRAMALLALPAARASAPRLHDLEQRLATAVEGLSGIAGVEAERARLEELTALSIEIERQRTTTAHRFGATRAYHQILGDRLRELREREVPGYQTIAEFLDRRLTPAMRTCESSRGRIEELANHVAAATALLRTRVDIGLESQNQQILASLDRRAETQVRIQDAVEGLSFVAISYYAIALAAHGLKALEHAGAPIDAETASGWLFFPALALVWVALRIMRRRLRR